MWIVKLWKWARHAVEVRNFHYDKRPISREMKPFLGNLFWCLRIQLRLKANCSQVSNLIIYIFREQLVQDIFVRKVNKYVGLRQVSMKNERFLLKNMCYKNRAIFQKKQTNFQEQKSAAQLQKRNPWAPPPHLKKNPIS